ncbi:MAG: DEAD/DEAH box helicase [Gammaproteobacteria bacterium]|nr:DEAD/DEAH box helicase [Gammaproteobacteria bacterium]MCH9762900.1 DEAD/DEAH box helicase [Gammaproteobacteria bacterium]
MTHPTEVVSFAELNLSQPLLKAVQDLKYETPSPIQQQTIPCLLEGRDVIGKSNTGSGKTAAFLLPALEKTDLSLSCPQVLIITPTRELALQIEMHAKSLSKYMKGARVVALCGGQDYHPQLKKLREGSHVVVGTPGRMLDHIERGSLQLDQLKTFVLDEADEMLRMGFIDDVERILSHLPKTRQIALFSATMPPPIRKIANRYLDNPVSIEISAKTATVETIEQRFLFASPVQKPNALLRVLAVEEHEGVIVFTRTKNGAEEVSTFLQEQGHRVMAIHGDISQALRERAIARFKQGAINILVATDVAARGLDVERVTHVINYDMAHDCETYVHRIGRTGRAGRSGTAILFVSPREARMVSVVERHTNQTIIKTAVPTDEMIQAVREKRFMAGIDMRLAHKNLPDYQKIIQSYLKDNDISAEDVAAALALQINRDKPWKLEAVLPPSKPERSKGERSSSRQDSRGAPRARAAQGSPRNASREHRRVSHTEELFRLDVGRIHGVKPANIVGAIANEGGLQSRLITGLKIHEDHSTVRLPRELPKESFLGLKRAWVCGRPLKLTSMGEV